MARRQVRFDADEELIEAIDKLLEGTEYSRSAWIRILLRESLKRREPAEISYGAAVHKGVDDAKAARVEARLSETSTVRSE